MKAVIISSLLFFSLRAMSSEVGENQKTECPFINQSPQAKVVLQDEVETIKGSAVKTISK
jgi:hypothetical protein